MKFLFSMLMTFSTIAHSGMIKITYTQKNKSNATHILKRFEQKYSIPSELIILKKVESCTSSDKRFLELCINTKGELIEFSNHNLKSITNSLKVFKKKVKNEN